MTLQLHSLGQMLVYPTSSITIEGPLTRRAAAHLGSVDWQSEALGRVTLDIGMGSYLQGADAAQVTVRMMLRTEDGTALFFQYVSVGEMASHIEGITPIFLAGQIEVDPTNSGLAWLNRVQLVGRGMLTMDPVCQSYEMAYIGER